MFRPMRASKNLRWIIITNYSPSGDISGKYPPLATESEVIVVLVFTKTVG